MGTPSPSASSAQNLRRVLFVMLAAVVVYGAFAVVKGLDKMAGALDRYAWITFLAACGLAFGNYVLRYMKWEFYLARQNIRGVGRVDSFLIFLSGFTLTVTPGKVGEAFKSVVLFETHQVPIPTTVPIVIAERLTDLIGIVLLILLGAAGFSGGFFWAGIGAIVVSITLAVLSSRTLSLGSITLMEKLPGPFQRIGPKVRQAYESLAVMVKPRNLLFPTVLSVAAWALECLALWVIVRGFGAVADLRICFFFYATSTLAGALVPVPGGLGVTEGIMLKQLEEIGKIEAAAATGSMILVRFATLWFAVAVGFVALSILKRRYPSLLAPPPAGEEEPA
jgi:uncharacterized protein (TIRG00374 family)